MRNSISPQSWASTPPAPGWIVIDVLALVHELDESLAVVDGGLVELVPLDRPRRARAITAHGLGLLLVIEKAGLGHLGVALRDALLVDGSVKDNPG
jgi:hypothetical protein